jgi:hypothetical protein
MAWACSTGPGVAFDLPQGHGFAFGLARQMRCHAPEILEKNEYALTF